MTEERMVALIDDLRKLPAETDWVEFKTDNVEPERIGRAVAAIANAARLADQPFGFVVWDIQDATHDVVGTSFEPTRLKRGNEIVEFWLAKALSPSPHTRFVSVAHPEGRVVLLEVPAASSVPVKFHDIAYIRIGSATPKLSEFPDREADLLGKLRPFLWEQGAARTFVTGDDVLDLLDQDAYFALTKQRSPQTRALVLERLAEDRLIARDVGDRWNVLNLGVILFARRLDGVDRLGRKALRVVRYEGSSRALTKRSQEEQRGYAAGFEDLLAYIDAQLPGEERIERGLRVERRTYPQIALRELVANALVHQDMTVTGSGPIVEIFHDRVEITNPGAPVTDMLHKLFGAPPRSRNEAMATLMRRMGICEELGSGLVKVVTAVEEHRLPAPSFEVVDGSTRVTLFGPKTFVAMDRFERTRVCYQHACLTFHRRERMTNESLRRRFGIEDRNAAQISQVFKDAQEQGLIRLADAERPKAGYVPYWA